MHDRVRLLVAAIADGMMATRDQVRGLSAEELSRVEQDQPAPLAGAYRLFLELAGAGAGHFLQGSDVFFPAVMGLGQAARELLEENQETFSLLDGDRVFFMQQGYQFLFLRGDGPDPAVWSYCETAVPGSGVPVRVFPAFTGWLGSEVRQQGGTWGRLVPWYEAEKRKGPGERRVYFRRRQPDGTVIDELLAACRPSAGPVFSPACSRDPDSQARSLGRTDNSSGTAA